MKKLTSKDIREETIHAIANQMANIWDGYCTDLELLLTGHGEIIEIYRGKEQIKCKILQPHEFINKWAPAIVVDYENSIKYISEEEYNLLKSFK